MKHLKRFNAMNESATQVPDGAGNMRNPEDTNTSTIWINGIYFWGRGFTSREIADKWNEEVYGLETELNLPIVASNYDVPEIKTEDIDVYFHGMEVVIKTLTDKYNLKAFTEMLADKISKFDLPITVTYSYMSRK